MTLDRITRARSFCYRVWHRTVNRWLDLRAVFAGYCNDCPWRAALDDGGGGYSFWRCDLRAQHEGLHRYRNYVWTADGTTDYAPVQFDATQAGQPWRRRSTPTLRQERERRGWLAERYETKSRRRAG